MKPQERIEKLIKERRYEASAEVYDKALGSFLQAVGEHVEQKSIPTEPKIWRIIMKSRITKLAAGVVVIIAAYIVLHQPGGSIDGASVVFAEMTENMKEMPWLHAVIEEERNEARSKQEIWLCFEQETMIGKHDDGKIRHVDFRKRILQVYDPDVNTVTVSHVPPDMYADGFGKDILDYPKAFITYFEKDGQDVRPESGEHQGRDVQIYRMSIVSPFLNTTIEMGVEPDQNIMLFLNVKVYHPQTGKRTQDISNYFDYPDRGPESIYDVGVPRSAKTVRGETEEEKTTYDAAFAEAISVVDSRESWPEPRELVVSYWQHRNAKNYDEMAILWPSSAVWNSQSLEKEEPVEYVFGKVQPWEMEGHIIVPYASKSYYGKHGKYSLKMVLSNKKSAKKRYYIVSGN